MTPAPPIVIFWQRDDGARFETPPRRVETGERIDAKTPRAAGPLWTLCYFCGKRADMRQSVEVPRCAVCHDRFRRKSG